MHTNDEPRRRGAGQLVFRQVALRPETFTKLKAIQRELEASSHRPLTNAEVISAAIARWPLRGA